jgi:hypothetical protein
VCVVPICSLYVAPELLRIRLPSPLNERVGQDTGAVAPRRSSPANKSFVSLQRYRDGLRWRAEFPLGTLCQHKC